MTWGLIGLKWVWDIFEVLWPSIQDNLHDGMQQCIIMYGLLDAGLALRVDVHMLDAQVKLSHMQRIWRILVCQEGVFHVLAATSL